MSRRQHETLRHKRSNENAERFAHCFTPHREHLTHCARRRDSQPDGSRLCVLGAGNAHDLDLEPLTRDYREVHLVDVDGDALDRAIERQPRGVRSRLAAHAGVDLSGMLGNLEALRDLEVEAETLLQHPIRTATELARALPGPFETVISACVLSQMHLSLRETLSSTHPLFEALTYTLNLTHLHSLRALCAPGGRAVLASDVADERLAPLDSERAEDPLQMLQRLAQLGNLFHAVDPMLLGTLLSDSPELASALSIQPIRDAWTWQIAPHRFYLVYALELTRVIDSGTKS